MSLRYKLRPAAPLFAALALVAATGCGDGDSSPGGLGGAAGSGGMGAGGVDGTGGTGGTSAGVPGISLTQISGDTSENGDQATFTVVLDAQPTSDVTVTLESSDHTEGTVSPTELVFTPDNWNAPQTVTVTGVDDDVADGNIDYEVRVASVESDDDDFDGLSADPVAVTNIDDETAGIIVVAEDTETSEAGDTAKFTVALSAAPTDDVEINFDSNDLTEGVVSTQTLTFTPDNWNAEQTVTVTGVDDDIKDGDITYAVEFSSSSSDDENYDGLTPPEPSIELVNKDNDTPQFIVSAPSGSTTEEGGTATFTVQLNGPPSDDVSITLSSSDETEGVLLEDDTTLTFTNDNWNSAQTVTVIGQDDEVKDGDQTYLVQFGASTSTDDEFAGLQPPDVELTNTDIGESVGFLVSELSSELSGNTSEEMTEATLTIRLKSQPTEDVIVSVSSSDESEGQIVSQGTLTFTADNWDGVQEVTVRGQDDAVVDGNQSYQVRFGAATSADSSYEGLVPPARELVNIDDETPGLIVEGVDTQTSEAGDQGEVTVRLTQRPSGVVTIPVSSSDESEGTLSKSQLTFDMDDYASPKSIIVTGVDDEIEDGNQTYRVMFGTATGGGYAGVNADPVEMLNVDFDDTAGILVSEVSGDTSEDGTQASFTVVLQSEPEEPVVIDMSSSDTSEGKLDKTQLTFTDENWSSPQTVRITGQDDALIDGKQAYSIVFESVTSSDTNYDGLTPAQLSLFNEDNDTAGVIVEKVDDMTSEAGGQGKFTVRLTALPSEPVTLKMNIVATDEAVLETDTLIFTTENWNSLHEVIVTGVDDSVDDGDQPYTIAFEATTSDDDDFDGLKPSDLTFTNVDNDTAGVTVEELDSITSEAGATARFEVVLNSEPSADVIVQLATTDDTEGTPDLTTLTFTNTNWNAAREVVVTGVDDDLADGNQPYAIDFEPLSSADGDYDGMEILNVLLTNEDNDTANVTLDPVDTETSESGDTGSFSIVLESEPFADVTVDLTLTDPTEGSLSTNQLVFTAADWETARNVVVSGLDDDLDDGNQVYQIKFDISSSDAAYDAETLADLQITNVDNDTAGIKVQVINSTSTEAGNSARFGVALNSEPFADVTIDFASSDTSEGVLVTSSLTIAKSDWDMLHVIEVKGQEDSVDDGNQPYTISFDVSSEDAAYDGMPLADIGLVNQDNDTAGVSLVATNGVTHEGGGMGSVTISLNSEPTALVTIKVASTDQTEGITTINEITFDNTNWNTTKAIPVLGVDDPEDPNLVDGDQLYEIEVTEILSDDPDYATAPKPSEGMRNEDLD